MTCRAFFFADHCSSMDTCSLCNVWGTAMEKELSNTTWNEVVGAALIVFLFLCFGLVAAGGWKWFTEFLAGSASSWVQAIGSIAAILGAFAIANKQTRTQVAAAEEASRQTRRQRLEVCHVVLIRVASVFDSAKKSLTSCSTTDVLRQEVAHARRMLDNLPLFEVPDPVLVHRFGLIGQSLQHLEIGLNQIDELKDGSTRLSYAENARQQSRECSTAIAWCRILVMKCSKGDESVWTTSYEANEKAINASIAQFEKDGW